MHISLVMFKVKETLADAVSAHICMSLCHDETHQTIRNQSVLMQGYKVLGVRHMNTDLHAAERFTTSAQSHQQTD